MRVGFRARLLQQPPLKRIILRKIYALVCIMAMLAIGAPPARCHDPNAPPHKRTAIILQGQPKPPKAPEDPNAEPGASYDAPTIAANVTEMTDALKKQGFDVHTVTSKQEFLDFVGTLKQGANQIGPNDELFIYYTGHGYRLPMEPTRTEHNDPQDFIENHAFGLQLGVQATGWDRSTILSATEFRQALEGVAKRTGHIGVVIDACYAGGFGKPLARVPGIEVFHASSLPNETSYVGFVAKQNIEVKHQVKTEDPQKPKTITSVINGTALDSTRQDSGASAFSHPYISGIENAPPGACIPQLMNAGFSSALEKDPTAVAGALDSKSLTTPIKYRTHPTGYSRLSIETRAAGGVVTGQDIRDGDYFAMDGIVREYLGRTGNLWEPTRNKNGSVTYRFPAPGLTGSVTAQIVNGQVEITEDSQGGINPGPGGQAPGGGGTPPGGGAGGAKGGGSKPPEPPKAPPLPPVGGSEGGVSLPTPGTERAATTALGKPPTKIANAPGYNTDAKTASGLYVATFTTPQGKIRVNLTDDIAAGDTLTGTVEAEPSGKTEAERAQNQAELNGYVVELQGQRTAVRDKKLTCSIPATLIAEANTLVLVHDSEPVATTQIPISATPPTTPPEFTMPTAGQQGSLIELKGPGNGTISQNDYVRVGGTTLPLKAKSPRKLVVLNTSEVVGATEIERSENGAIMRCPYRNIGIKLSAGKLNLLRGQTTTLHTVVLGLAGITENVPLDLVNDSPTIITMSGGEVQHLVIHPAEVQEDGTTAIDRTLTGIMAGAFGITGKVRLTNTCTWPTQ